VQTARSLADLVEARCRTSSSFLTYRGSIPAKPEKGYAVADVRRWLPVGDRLAGSANALAWSFRAMCVGYSDGQCLYVVEKFDALFIGWRPLASNGPWFSRTPDDPPVIKTTRFLRTSATHSPPATPSRPREPPMTTKKAQQNERRTRRSSTGCRLSQPTPEGDTPWEVQEPPEGSTGPWWVQDETGNQFATYVLLKGLTPLKESPFNRSGELRTPKSGGTDTAPAE
jgi:hypothetical protein